MKKKEFNTHDNEQTQHNDGFQVEELEPGLGIYIRVKAYFEKKYGQKITEVQMRQICDLYLKQSTHERYVKKRYGEAKNKWKERYEGWADKI